MPFDGLPAELKLSIAEHLDPISSFSFAIASRLNWVVCEPVVRKHAWLYQEYKTIDACHAGTLLWNTLKAILKDPSLGWYVRELDVPGSRQYDWNEDGERGSGNLPPNNYEAFEEATQELYAIYPPSSEPQEDVASRTLLSLVNGSDEAIITVLVHHLPMLKTLRITNLAMGGGCFQIMLREVALRYSQTVSENLCQLPFQRLESVSVAHHDSEFHCSPKWLLNFSAIPTLRNFAGWANGADCILEMRGHPALQRTCWSNIRELFLLNSTFDIEAFEVIIKGIRSLERLTYQSGGATVAESDLDAKGVVKILAKYQCGSLEHLYLDDAADGDLNENHVVFDCCALRDLKKLKTLRCTGTMLYPLAKAKYGHLYQTDEDDEDGDILADPRPAISKKKRKLNEESAFDLTTVIPESVHSLRLDGPFIDENGDSAIAALQHRSGKLPNLKNVYICLNDFVRYSESEPKVITEPNFATTAVEKHPLWMLLDGHGYQ